MSSTMHAFMGAGGHEIVYQSWLPQGPARAGVLIVHGMGEHSGRYDHVASFLSERGLAVWSHDQQGHGRFKGELGTVESFDYFLDDIDTMVAEAGLDRGEMPWVLLGHSMGGLIVTAYLLERAKRPDLVVLSGPAILPILDPGDDTIDPTRLSRDPDAWAAYLEDPLVLRERVQEGLFARLGDGMAKIVGRAAEIDAPVLLIHGEDDRLCSAEGAHGYLEQSSSTDRTYHLYPEGRHEMFNEINRTEVLERLWQWLDERLPAAAAAEGTSR